MPVRPEEAARLGQSASATMPGCWSKAARGNLYALASLQLHRLSGGGDTRGQEEAGRPLGLGDVASSRRPLPMSPRSSCCRRRSWRKGTAARSVMHQEDATVAVWPASVHRHPRPHLIYDATTTAGDSHPVGNNNLSSIKLMLHLRHIRRLGPSEWSFDLGADDMAYPLGGSCSTISPAQTQPPPMYS